jgi:hypothetical protein
MQRETTTKFLDMEPHIRQARGTAEALLAGLSEENHLMEGAAEALARQTDEISRIWSAAQRAQAEKIADQAPLSAQERASKQLASALGRLDSLTSTLSCLAASDISVEALQGGLRTVHDEASRISNELESTMLGLQRH